MIVRVGGYVGGFYTGAVALWLFTTLLLGNSADVVARQALDALLLSQALVVLIAVPVLCTVSDMRAQLPGIATLVAVPWPLMVLMSEMTVIDGFGLISAQVVLLIVAAVASSMTAMLRAAAMVRMHQMLCVVSVQVSLALLFWSFRAQWLERVVG